MKKVKVDEATYARLKKLAKIKEKTIAEVIAQKVNITVQFDKHDKDGVLRRTYYYQRDRYGDVKSLEKFLKKWNKNEKFKMIWDNYRESEFNTGFAPTFFRWGNDTQKEKLYVAVKGNVKNEKELLEMGY